ncbi:MAG: acyl-CoA thioesterase [Myxococcales bacterium]|nr:acyl-CoA thioesterase [Myxococcales bacterium]
MSLSEHLAGFPITLRWPVAWGDMDAFQHVNNVVYFRWFESARIAYFEACGWNERMRTSGVGPILAHTACAFRAPLTFPDHVLLGARAEGLEADRFTMRYRVVSEALGRVAAEGEGRVVSYDYRAAAKAPIPEDVRRAILDLEGRGGGQ